MFQERNVYVAITCIILGDSFWNYKEHVSSLINQPDVNFGINIKEFNKLYGSQARDKLLMEVS
jgi:UDP-galactopyranose mutase